MKPGALRGVVGTLAAFVLALVCFLAGWYAHSPASSPAGRSGQVTVLPPCFERVPGFQLPPGGRWC